MREAELEELVRVGAAQALRTRKRVHLADAAAEALDQPVPDRERRVERDLLRSDRCHQRLERIGCQRRPQAGELAGQAGEHGLPAGPLVERAEIELRAEQLANHRPGLGIERLDAHAAARRRDPHLSPPNDAAQGAVDPEVREVRPERAVAPGRELEVIGLWQAEERH